jgi:hypothetical protein
MKHFYFYFFLFSFFAFNLSFGQGLENFTNSNAGGGYTTNSFTGNNEITWSYVASRDANNDFNNSGISLPALMLRRVGDGSKITSSTISGGISDFSVKLYKGFTGAGNRQVELFINGVSQGTSTVFNNYLENTFTVSGINIAGDIVIEIVNTTSTQVIIDDITWTGFSTSCGVIFNQATVNCEGSTIGDNNDLVTVSIPYTGSDAGITSVTTTSGGTVGGDDPSTTADGTIVITGLSEGSAWDVILNGGDCEGTYSSGTIGADICDPIPNTCFDLSGGTESFELVTVGTNSEGDAWTNSSGSYAMNGYCNGCANVVSDTWLIFGPLNTTQTSDLALVFDATEQFSQTDLIVAYTTQYDGCPGSTQWTTASTLTDSEAAEVDLSAAQGSAVYIGIQYYEDGAGGSSGWTLTNVSLNSFGNCPVLGTVTPSDCAVCDMSLDSAEYTCSTNTAGDNNDAVTITISYTGSESTLVSITTSTTGTVGGDDPTTVADGSITITGLSEGDAWDITLNGGDCDGTTISGTVPAAACDPVTQDLIINEVLGDPDSDANEDGTYDYSDDEFIEFYNIGSAPLDISGYTISDNSGLKHTFPANSVINPSEFLIVFGGGVLNNFTGNAQLASSGSIGITNGGDILTVKNVAGAEVLVFTYTSTNNQSLCRQPDFTGDFVPHLSHTANAVEFSPGRRNDVPLSTGTLEISRFEVYPNPSNTGFVTIKSNQMGAVQAQVFDLLGKEVINTVVNNERLDVSNLNAGVYVVKLTQNKNTTTRKLIIQ